MTRLCFLFITSVFFIHLSYGQQTTICGTILNLPNNDGIKCSFVPNNVLAEISAITIPLDDGKFSRQLDIKQTTFLSFAQDKNYFAGFIQPGDSIVIMYDAANFPYSLAFAGKGKEKFVMVQSINKTKSDISAESKMAMGYSFPLDYFFLKADSIETAVTAQIAREKPYMSKESFELLNSYLASTMLTAKYNGIQPVFGNLTYDEYLKQEQAKLTTLSSAMLQNLFKFNNKYANSFFYIKAVYNLLSLHFENNILPAQPGIAVGDKYNYIKNLLPIDIKAPVLYLFLKNEIKNTNDNTIDPLIDLSFPSAKDSSYKKAILKILSVSRELKPGSVAPDFSLEDRAGKRITLASFKGKVVYIDFWFASCTPCHALFNEIKPVKAFFKPDTNVVFLTVSVDNRATWEKALLTFKIEGYHAFTQNKFRNHPVISAYNVIEYPTAYIIDKKGMLFNTSPSRVADALKKEVEAALVAGGD